MGYTQKVIRFFLLSFGLLLYKLVICQQQQRVDLDRQSFLRYVLDDFSTEPLRVVYFVRTGSYVGPVMTRPTVFHLHLKNLAISNDSTYLEKGIEVLMRSDTVPMEIEWHHNHNYIFPEEDCWVFRFRNKSTKRILRYFFDKDYLLKRNLTAKEEAALIVILFERNLPYRISGYGSGLDWSRLNWPKF